MKIKERFKKLRNDYVINQVNRLSIPNFEPDDIRRYRITFSGRVQKVGFRLEVCELAKRLDLTGFCRNLENGDVLAEMQGSINKIEFLVSFMGSLKRIKIRSKIIEEVELLTAESDFLRQ